jgi:transposase InsO family protein
MVEGMPVVDRLEQVCDACTLGKQHRVEVELESKLKALRTDRGGEFNSRMFTTFCTEQGIKHFTTTPYTPQQNGFVERRNQSVVEMARCLLKGRSVPPRF